MIRDFDMTVVLIGNFAACALIIFATFFIGKVQERSRRNRKR